MTHRPDTKNSISSEFFPPRLLLLDTSPPSPPPLSSSVRALACCTIYSNILMSSSVSSNSSNNNSMVLLPAGAMQGQVAVWDLSISALASLTRCCTTNFIFYLDCPPGSSGGLGRLIPRRPRQWATTVAPTNWWTTASSILPQRTPAWCSCHARSKRHHRTRRDDCGTGYFTPAVLHKRPAHPEQRQSCSYAL